VLVRPHSLCRLGEIDPPEKGQDWGNRARQALAERVFQKDVRVDVSDTDRYGQLIGKI
jgi:endonuclease YncB( thermonuclease family)